MRLHNTLTGISEEFVPADGKKVKMYVCGVTPYAPVHVGHALSYVAFDVLRRYLEYLGYQVEHVQKFRNFQWVNSSEWKLSKFCLGEHES